MTHRGDVDDVGIRLADSDCADGAAKIFVDAGPGQVFEVLLRGLARRHRLVGITVFQFVERETDAAGEAKRLGCSYADIRFTRSVSSGVNANRPMP